MVVAFSHCWRRCYLFWAQVVPIVGAGEEKGWGPAPRNAVLCLEVAQVPPQNTYLRQSGPRPAPGKVLTCAVMAIDLRQELRLTERCPLSFAPGNLYRAMPPCHSDRAEASGEICGALRQTGAREWPFCALCRWLRCARGRFRPVAHRGRPGGATRRVPMCGSLAKWGNGAIVWREMGNRGRDSRSSRE